MNKPTYSISKNNNFVITNYNSAPTFASFFPGIAGIYGCPMWVFYANRGQGITSAGVHDKNGAILEFLPANKAFRQAAMQGFRTFIKVDGQFYEPFKENSPFASEMQIAAEGLTIAETNTLLKLKVEVSYFTLPGEAFPALVRIVKISNLSTRPKKIEVIDGLPVIIPFGFQNDLLKNISRTIEAWCIVENLKNNAPYYKLKVAPADASETKFIKEGNFYLSFGQENNKSFECRKIVDPTIVFGETTSLESPTNFIENNHFPVPANQQVEGFTPSAFSYSQIKLAAKGEAEICSLLGQADNLEHLGHIKKKVSSRQYLQTKELENKRLIDGICSGLSTNSSSKSFDQYAKITYLDNVMRGGLPVKLGNKVIYLFYRKHGDMERDYNDFKLLPTYFSQGNGNYRDINQNRRNDLFFNPEIEDDNIIRFFNLIQLDGFNPLVVLGSKYYLKSVKEAEALISQHLAAQEVHLVKSLTKAFMLGSLLKDLDKAGTRYKTSKDDFVKALLSQAEAEEGAFHGEGFWIDHFSYNTDLLESFESLFPEKIGDVLFNKKAYTFFDNDHLVLERKDKYRLVNDKVRQYESLRTDAEKKSLINHRIRNKNLVRTDYGKGDPFYTTLAAKILCIVVNRAASFDAEGVGIEMEAEKPDWYDALNGLPGLLGSSLSETLELKRLALYLAQHISAKTAVTLPIEVKNFVEEINRELTKEQKSKNSFLYWDIACQIKEAYRRQTKLGVSGEEITIARSELLDFLNKVINKCQGAVKKCLKKHKNYYTYFINEAVDFKLLDGHGVKIKNFKQTPLPLFLEGFVHALKVEKDKNIYQLVKDSPLYDEKLKMYKVNSPLQDQSLEIGRARIFTPGWLENESIWLHMEYKYLLELLKAGLYKEFFADFKDVLVPFMDPKQYKRSVFENSSFLVSSANPNKSNHGRGFVARLSGGAAEFIDMWIIMMTGKKLFSLDGHGKLVFKLAPVIPAWLFKGGKLTFNLLGTIETTYINPKNRDTFEKGVEITSYKMIFYDDEAITVNDSVVKEPYASFIRERKVKKMVVTLS